MGEKLQNMEKIYLRCFASLAPQKKKKKTEKCEEKVI